MNKFATIKPLFRYNRVAYYSVSLNGNKKSLYEEFVAQHEKNNNKKLYHILKWIQVIGKKYGAQSNLFRNEAYDADASALPPVGKDREPCYVENGKKKANPLRLYCLRASEKVVFLFSGDIKTKKYAQDCPNVKDHFKLANQLTKAIDKAFRNGEIWWIEDDTMIETDDDFKLYY